MSEALKPKATILDLDALMDMKMNDIETLPDYITPPAGLYMLAIKDCTFEKYDVKDEQKKAKNKNTQDPGPGLPEAPGRLPRAIRGPSRGPRRPPGGPRSLRQPNAKNLDT